MAADTNNGSAVTVERDARILRESLTRCRRDCSMPVVDAHIRNLHKRLDNARIHSCEHIVELTRDAFERGAPRSAVEGFFRAGLAMVATWYDGRDEMPDLPTLIRLETEAQAVADVGEINIALEPTSKTIADGTELLRGHLVALDRLVSACERMQFDAPASPSTRRMVA